jgi:tetratricopeptide (TPR) repeat protein
MQSDLPDSREALYRLAVSQRRAQRVPEAIATLQQLESRYPPFGSLFEEVGLCLLLANEPAKALLAFARAVELNNCLLDSWRALEQLYRAAGQQTQAQQASAQVAVLSALPREIQLACSRFFDGNRVVAEELTRQYMAIHGEHVEALRLLAKMATDAGAEYDAELMLQRAVALAPEHETARHELALVLLSRQKHTAARAQVTRLLAASPAHSAYRRLDAEAAAGTGNYSEALPLYGSLLRENPQDPDLYLAIGNALKTTGKTAEAVDSYHYAIAARPGYGEAYWALANLKTYGFSDAELTAMRQGEASSNTTPVDRYHLCFALGKALEDLGHFQESFEYYERGNALKRATLHYRPGALEQVAQRQTAVCTPQFFAARQQWGSASNAPIFIVGLPRSGSTLVEQILGSHSQVEGTLELADIPRLVQELQTGMRDGRPGYPELLGALSADQCRHLGEKYLADTAAYRTGKPRFTDKMPNNFRHLGLLHLILPSARIIDVRREPMACGFSIFKQLFANGQRFAYSLEEIARYYRMYVQLMAHWERVLPGKILRVQYEDLVSELEPTVRRMLDFCGLEFESGCVEFHRTRRTVHTPSSEQVHQPLYRESLDQWRNYERWLAPLRRALAS